MGKLVPSERKLGEVNASRFGRPEMSILDRHIREIPYDARKPQPRSPVGMFEES